MAEQKSNKQSVYSKGKKRFQLVLGLIAVVLASLLYTATAHAATVKSIKLVPANGHTKLLIDLDAPAAHHLFLLEEPKRVVIDIPKSKISHWAKMPAGTGVVTRIRHGEQSDRLRLVADIKSNVLVTSQLVNLKNKSTARRLVVELSHEDQAGKLIEPVKVQDAKIRDLVVAIDAGHGGVDPGSIGPRGTHEKQVVLAIAKKLATKLNAEKGLKAYLVRPDDKKVPYRQRIARARQQNADMFISIHADSYRDASVTGSSVYVLSQRGASSSTARWLANKLNSSDLVGGVSLKDKDDTLASVLLDLSQSATIAASTRLGKEMLDELASIGRVRKKEVQYANFAVLKSPDVPSILVETGYISNPDEERKLRDTRHQNKIATALFAGVKNYFTNNPPNNSVYTKKPVTEVPKVYVAELGKQSGQNSQKKDQAPPEPIKTSIRQATVTKSTSAEKRYKQYVLKPHTVRSGESLSSVSARYNVKISALKQINKLKSNSVKVGQVLQVPVSST